jgi:alanyl-tRNA synthetase
MTRKLYQDDSYATEFQARVVSQISGAEGVRVVLDGTYFYPTSGGQPHDLGLIDGVQVLDVIEEGDEIVHLLAGPVEAGEVTCTIDWARRFDHMQQHSGQHILSAVFEDEADAPTVSFHLGDQLCTIDLGVDRLDAEAVSRVERRANEVVLAALPVDVRVLDADGIAQLPLRKPPTREADIRVVSMGAVDNCACGGTHVRSTHEIGPIKVRRWQTHRQGVRVEFLCGWRAMDDYAWKHEAISTLAAELSVKDAEALDTVRRMVDELKIAHKAVADFSERELDLEAEALLAQARDVGGASVLVKAFDERDPEEVRRLAMRLAEGEGRVALLGLGGPRSRLFFARSDDLPSSMADLLKAVCKAYGGGGGGQPHAAQGGGMPGDSLADALDYALETYREGVIDGAGDGAGS